MLKYNFNITWPIADFFFGTVYREPKPAAAPQPAPHVQESAPAGRA
jgi:hypothetical protein